MKKIDFKIKELELMKKYPNSLYYDGDLELLNKRKISIVGSRKPTKYSRQIIGELSSKIGKFGVVVSGGAMGIDAIAHQSAGAKNTICVLANGVDVRYPAVNKNLLDNIAKDGLLLSQFEIGSSAKPYTFVLRNELVVALGDVLIVGEADEGSGTMRSVDFALEMKKEIFVLPQRVGESCATNRLLQDGKAKAIYDVDLFVNSLFRDFKMNFSLSDDFLLYCKTNPNYDEVVKKFPTRVFEAELMGEITIKNGMVYIAQNI